jgi:4-alpha-glucanotransferase
MRYAGGDGRDLPWLMIRLALATVTDLAVVPAQDLLALGPEARMNRPGVARGNWSWRVAAGALTHRVSDRLRDLAAIYGRFPPR